MDEQGQQRAPLGRRATIERAPLGTGRAPLGRLARPSRGHADEVGLRAPVHRIAAAAPIVPARSAAESLARDRARAAMFTPVR